MTANVTAICPLCDNDGGVLVFRSDQLRVILADEPDFPAFYRVIWNAHVAEFSDLSSAERSACMNAVATVEQVLRAELNPTKINLAALGNMVPHLHWHVVARFDWDSHFPAPLWATGKRPPDSARLAQLREQMRHVSKMIADTMSAQLSAPTPNLFLREKP